MSFACRGCRLGFTYRALLEEHERSEHGLEPVVRREPMPGPSNANDNEPMPGPSNNSEDQFSSFEDEEMLGQQLPAEDEEEMLGQQSPAAEQVAPQASDNEDEEEMLGQQPPAEG